MSIENTEDSPEHTLKPALEEGEGATLVDALQKYTREQIIAAIPKEVMGKENYTELLDPNFKGYWHPNQLAGTLFPYKPDPRRPIEILKAIAKNLIKETAESTDKRVTLLAKALQARLYENMKKLSEEPLILVGLNEEEEAIRISFKELEKKFKEIKAQTSSWDPDTADLRMAIELGFFSETEIKSKANLREINGLNSINPNVFKLETKMLKEEIAFGTQLLGKIAEHTKKEMQQHREYLGETIQFPEINPDLQDLSLMELLEKLFDKKTDARTRNDIQLKLVFASLGLLSTKRLETIERTILKKMRQGIRATFTEDSNPKILPEISYEHGSFSITEHKQEVRVKMFKDKAYLTTDSQLKTKESKVIKLLYPDEQGITPNNLTDEARMRIVGLEWTSKELTDDPTLQNDSKELLKTLWENMGNTGKIEELPEKDRSQEKNQIRALKKGEALLVNKLDHPHYPKITLYGKDQEGVMTEIQWLPVDTYLLDEAKNSPFAHHHLDAEKLSNLCELAIPGSLNSAARRALILGNQRRNDLRNPGDAARRKFLNNAENLNRLKASSPNSPSPAPQEPQA